MGYPDACISIAMSSHCSLLLAVHAQVTEPGDARTVELDAPVTAVGTLMSQLCVQLGEWSVTPPYIDGESRTMLFGCCIVIDIEGTPEVPCNPAMVGIGFVWSTPDKEYAPTTTEVGPDIVTTMFAAPAGFARYQNSASLLKNDCISLVSCTPPNVTEVAKLLFASTATTSNLLVPVPALKLEIVIWFGDEDTVPDAVWIPFRTTPLAEALVVVDVLLAVVVVDVLLVVVVVDVLLIVVVGAVTVVV